MRLIALFAALLLTAFSVHAEDSELSLQKQAAGLNKPCNGEIDRSQTQFIVGYGSLMQQASRERTAPHAGPALAIVVKGYQRGWFAAGTSHGFDTTYLGAVPSHDASFNAVMFSVPAASMAEMDRRESFYCRVALNETEVMAFADERPLLRGQVWMYVNGPHSIGLPSSQKPIVQSYVDVFIGGCLSVEADLKSPGFARACIESTAYWSSDWVNDRLYPRRPFIYQPQATEIDALLKSQLPDLFSRIRIE